MGRGRAACAGGGQAARGEVGRCMKRTGGGAWRSKLRKRVGVGLGSGMGVKSPYFHRPNLVDGS
jgi:hypothetical protein